MKIIIATDGSGFSTAAIEKCCQMFGKLETLQIRIVSAASNTNPIPTGPFMFSTEYLDQISEIVKQQAAAAAKSAETQVRALLPDARIDLTTKILVGAPDRMIIEEAESWKADLIVVGSHGYGFWGRLWLGSVSQSVMQHAHCSVLVVRTIDEQEPDK